MKNNSRLLRYLIPAAVIVIGIGFVLFGISEGEAAAVLKKAINICMECIGLG